MKPITLSRILILMSVTSVVVSMAAIWMASSGTSWDSTKLALQNIQISNLLIMLSAAVLSIVRVVKCGSSDLRWASILCCLIGLITAFVMQITQ